MEPISHPIPSRLWVIQLAEQLSGRIKRTVDYWPNLEKHRLGDQLIRAIDSVGANITEGYVRIHVKERLNFFSIAQGSLEEALFHLRRARERQLITALEGFTVSALLIKLSKAVGNLSKKQTARSKCNY